MTKLFSLTKVQLKDFLSKYQESLNTKNPFLGKILMVFLLILMFFPAIELSLSFYTAFAAIGQGQLIIAYLYIASVIMMLFTGVPFIVSTFFYSKDLKFLASLPISESTIIFAKLSSIYVYLLGIGAMIFAPGLVIYGIKTGITVSFLIFGLLAWLLTPIMPLLISALIILPLMRIISNSRRRNLLTIISGLLFVTIILLFQTFISHQEMRPELIQQMVLEPNGLLQFIGAKFPPSVWVTKMVTGSLVDALIFVALNLVLVAALRGLAKTFYHRAMMQYNMESSTGEGKLYYTSRSKGLQLLRRNVLIILKQPTFFLNTILSLVVPLLMFVIMLASGEVTLTMFKKPEFAPYVLLIYAAAISAPAVIANISSTAITREGRAFWETKVLPISAQDNIRYRVLTTMLFNFAGSIVVGIAALFFLPLTVQQFIIAVLICISLTLFLATADIAINILRPLLNWINPTAAVKNNMNVMISLGVRVVVGFVVYCLLKILPGMSLEHFMIILIVLFTLLYTLSRFLVYGWFAKEFQKIAV